MAVKTIIGSDDSVNFIENWLVSFFIDRSHLDLSIEPLFVAIERDISFNEFTELAAISTYLGRYVFGMVGFLEPGNPLLATILR